MTNAGAQNIHQARSNLSDHASLHRVVVLKPTSPDRLDSSTRQLPCSRTISHVVVPGKRTTTSPGTNTLDDTALHTC
ncbi:MAG: hypothetical protein FRX49_11001 [Trebouxia sp. A1-2]|nr:MAG: hypothetical protein FRX49_11001 [Trebouxia sp. A1-2]